MGARLRVPFPVAVRASFGYWFSYFCVISRLILAMFWFGVNCTNGASCVTQVSSSNRAPRSAEKFELMSIADVDRHLAFIQKHPQQCAGVGGHDDPRVLLIFSILCAHLPLALHSDSQTGTALVHQGSDGSADGLDHGHLSSG